MALAFIDVCKTATVEINRARVKVARDFKRDVFEVVYSYALEGDGGTRGSFQSGADFRFRQGFVSIWKALSLRQSDTAQQVLKAFVRTQRVKARLDFQPTDPI